MTFDDWFYGLEGYALRAERFYDDYDRNDITEVLRWIKAAYEVGLEHGKNECRD